jgi:hypothetical protein
MLKMRPDQMRAFAVHAERQLAARIVKYVRREFPSAVAGLPLSEQRARVRYGMWRARNHRLERERSLTTFVTLMYVIGPDFDRHPDVQVHLLGAASPDDAFDALLDGLGEEHWNRIARGCSSSVWMEAREQWRR